MTNKKNKPVFADLQKLQENISQFNGKLLSFGGTVTKVREGQTKTGNSYAIFKIREGRRFGEYEIPLFGKDYIEFGKFARRGLSIYIIARVQPKEWNSTEFELKIQSIRLLSDVNNDELRNLRDRVRANRDEKEIFPYQNYELLIWGESKDKIPHFHIISIQDEYNVRVDFEGNVISVKKCGNRTNEKSDFLDVEKNAKKWLKRKPAEMENRKLFATNRKFLEFMWKILEQYY